MTAIKICGLKHYHEILWANQLKIDYVGLVFASSIRQIQPEKAKNITRILSPQIKKVGVFVNYPLVEIKKIITYCNLDIVQLHGEESPEYCQQLELPIWKAIRVKNEKSLQILSEYDVEGFVLDAYHPQQHGGCGISFDWSILHENISKHRIILAGGLNPVNITQALQKTVPYAIDVSSGVEFNGHKNYQKMLTLVKKVRDYDAISKQKNRSKSHHS